MDNLLYEELPQGEQTTSKYFLLGEEGQEGRTEITKWQYEQVLKLKENANDPGNRTYTDEDLVRLHQGQDNAPEPARTAAESNVDQPGVPSAGTDDAGDVAGQKDTGYTGRAPGDVFGEANTGADVKDIKAAESALAAGDTEPGSEKPDPAAEAESEEAEQKEEPTVTDTLADGPAIDAVKQDEEVQSDETKPDADANVGAEKPRGRR